MAEKNIAELPRDLRELYERGNAALQKKNYDYAIAIYNQVLGREPGFYACREALRACQLNKAGTGGGFFKKMLGTASVSPLLAKAQMQVRNNPVEALATCEQILNSEPNNTAAHKWLAEAALALEFPRTAVLSLEIAFKNNPGDKEIGNRLGEALTVAGQNERAMTIYTELQKVFPQDAAIAMSIKNLAAKQTMSQSGYEAVESGSGSYRDILRDKGQAASLEQEGRQVKSDDVASELIREYQGRLEKEPNNRRLLKAIADLYAQKKDYDKALEYLGMMSTIEGQSDPTLEKAIADTRLRKLDHAISLIDESAPEAAERRAALDQERQEFRIAEARRLVDKYPNDLNYRFELGKLLFELGKTSDAISEFQKAQMNPNKKIASQFFIGKCFAKQRMYDLAARRFESAIAEKQIFDDEKKELIYELGSVLENQGKTEEAITQYKQIYEIDIGYRDVAAKVDAYYAGAR
ncbi:MAG TPA: tetratricopeptide repeat protein [Verrucomicrobiae bacterium]